MLPLLYLHGLSTGDFAPALEGFFGSSAGLSASVITRLTTACQRSSYPAAQRGGVQVIPHLDVHVIPHF